MDQLNLKVIKTERVTDTIYQLLRDNIIRQRLLPGTKVNPDELASHLGVSRTPVHEALVLLASDGLVEIQPRKGTFIVEFTLDDFSETFDIRRALELLACETAIENAAETDFEAFAALIDAVETSVAERASTQEAARVHDARNLEFHQRLVALSGNKRLIATYENLRAHLSIARAHINANAWLTRLPEERAEHEAILAALRARDVARLKDALDQHLRRSKASLMADLEAKKGGAP